MQRNNRRFVMKGFFLMLLLEIAVMQIVLAQDGGQIYVSGKVKSNRNDIKLYVAFNRDYIIGQGEGENVLFQVPVNKNGKFNFTFPSVQHPARISIFDAVSNNNLFINQIAEAGDNIYLDATIQDDDSVSYFKAAVRGKGAIKYRCSNELNAIADDERIFEEKDPVKLVQLYNTILADKLEVVDRYKAAMGKPVYQLMRADIEGDLKRKMVLRNICRGIFSDDFPVGKKAEMRNKLTIFMEKGSSLSDDVLAVSTTYPAFFYELAKIELTLEYNGKNFELKDLYNKLKGEYAGLLREKLLSYCLLNSLDLALFYKNTTTDDYTACIKDAIKNIKTSWLQQAMNNLLSAKGKGAAAFNFTLPADSTNQEVTLTSLKGKVVLMDIWAYQCSGCNAFAKVFHDKIYPLFKDNPDFAVVSIMGDPSTREGYMRRLRREDNLHYTYPEYINLFAGKGIQMGRLMAQHYNINAWPMILLIGKNGGIFSSMVPFFTDPTSPNIEKLVSLIKEAIQQS